MPQSRRLAAIMFTDIVGYTAMMQRNEKEGLAKVHRFSEVMEANASANHGEILEFRGDGCLAVFKSAVEAMHAAQAIQESLKESPVVPLRIGIHIGDIVFADGNIYGDGVNLASRVESMGVPGSILVTERVIHDVKSHPEFEMASLGKFQFKNVEKPMEVFALANEGFVVPSLEEMKGKGKKLEKKELSGHHLILGILGILLLGLFLWFIAQPSFSSIDRESVARQFVKARVAVLPFSNKTGNPKFDHVGEFTADWLTSQIMLLDSIEIVSLQTIKDQLKYAGSGSNPTIDPSFYERTGAEKLIRGSYYLEDNQLVFNCQVEDVRLKKVDLALPMVRAEQGDISKSVQEFSNKVLTYLILDKSDLNSFSGLLEKNPPDYEAYQYFVESNPYFGTDYDIYFERMEFIMEKDPDFFMPYLQYGHALSNLDRWEKLDSLIQYMEDHVPRSTRYERLYFEHLKQTATRNNMGKYKVMKEIFHLDPKQPLHNYLTSLIASDLNYPSDAVRYFSYIPAELYPAEHFVNTWWFRVYAYSLMRINQAEKAKTILGLIPESLWDQYLYGQMAKAHMLLGEKDSIQTLWKRMNELDYQPKQLFDFSIILSSHFGLYLSDTVSQKHWAHIALTLVDKHKLGDDETAYPHFLLGNWRQALPFYEKTFHTNNELPRWHIVPLGIIYIKLDKHKELQAFKTKLNKLIQNSRNKHQYIYSKALVLAHEGAKEESVSLLKQAFRAGTSFEYGTFDESYELLPLHGYPPYEDFVKPKSSF